MEPIRVVQMGVGAIGREVCRILMDRVSVRLVGAIDTDPDLVGHPLSEVLEIGEDCGIEIGGDAEAVLQATDPDVLVHATGSHLPDVIRQIERAAMLGANVVSSCEELVFPRLRRPGEAAELEMLALDNNVAILGTGVNPGFVLDTLAVVATAVCRRVERVEGRRIVDAATRRFPLQRKIGAGMSVGEFETLVAQGKLGHVGLAESAALIAHGLGWRWDSVDQNTEPVVAEQDLQTEFLQVAAGQVAGIRDTARVIVGGQERVRLELQMFVGATAPQDELTIFGDPNLSICIPGGTPGDLATAAILANAVPAIAEAPRGLLTMLDMPILRCRHHEIRP